MRRVDFVVAVHADPGEKRQTGRATQLDQRLQGTAAGFHEAADVLGEPVPDAGRGRVHERVGFRVQLLESFAEYFSNLGFVVVDLVVSYTPPQGAVGAGVTVHHLLFQVLDGHGFFGSA